MPSDRPAGSDDVCVLGAASPLGAAIVRGLLAENYAVTGFDCETSGIEDIPDARYKRITADWTQWPDQLSEQSAAYGLVVLPHVRSARPFLALDMDEWRSQFERNVRLPLLALRSVLPGMQARKAGSVVLFSSIGARTGLAGNAASAASLGGLLGLARSAALEVARDNVRINVISPEHSDLVDVTGDVDGLAEAVSFLLARDNAYLTGQDLRISAARTMF